MTTAVSWTMGICVVLLLAVVVVVVVVEEEDSSTNTSPAGFSTTGIS
jgi:hypothetical protein